MSRSRPKKAAGRLLRLALMTVGWVAVAAGVAGIFLPLVPTVPLLLLAAGCFARSSDSFHRWLVEHRRLGPLIRDYLHGDGIPQRAKVTAIVMVWLSISLSMYFVPAPWVKMLLATIATGITVYLVKLPTLNRTHTEEPFHDPGSNP